MSIIPSLFDRQSNVFHPAFPDILDPFDGSLCTFSFPRKGIHRETSASIRAPIDWRETPEAHVFKSDLPGLKKEEVKVEVEDGKVLRISGERTREEEHQSDTWHRIERSSGKFLRQFRLPEDVKVDEIKAAMEGGVLTVTVPKIGKEKPATNVNSIEISSS